MSIQSAQEFIDRANQDGAIRKLALERFDDIVTVGRDHGYDFAWDEFEQAMRERKAMAQGPSGGRGGGRDDYGATCQCTPAGRRDDDYGATCQCTPAGRRNDADDYGATCQCTPSGGPRR